MDYRKTLIISDVDGTLLEKGFGVPGRNIQAVERFVERGGRFTVATDRSVESVGRFVQWIPLSAPAILLGGAVIYDYKNERFLKRRPISGDWRRLIQTICGEFPAMSAEAYCDEFCYIVKTNDCAVRQHALEHTSFTVTDPEFAGQQVYKLRLCGPANLMQGAFDRLTALIQADHGFKNLCAVRTGAETVDVYPRGANKRAAAAELAMQLGIGRENIAAIGDGEEDLPLLQYAGFSALTGNAPESALGGADMIVAGCSQGGLADFIELVERRCGAEK